MNLNPFKQKLTEGATELIALQESFNTLNESFATLTADYKNATEMQATFQAENLRLDEANKALTVEIETLKAQEASVIQDKLKVDELAALKAAEVIASAGHSQVEVLEDVTNEPEVLDNAALITKFKSLKGAELQEFYNANKPALQTALNSK